MKNKISTVVIKHYTITDNGSVAVEISRKPWRRKHAPGYNKRVYNHVTTPSANRIAKIVSDMIRNGKARGSQKKTDYGTETGIIPRHKNDPQ